MQDSPPPENTNHRGRSCDFCNNSPAILYCRADTAKLCLSCDREVHSTNPLFTKHTRSLLCDGCDSSPASIFCTTDAVVHCQNCDWETHNKTGSGSGSGSGHDRRPLEGFSGCPSVSDLLSILGCEDLSKKGVLFGWGSEGGSEFIGSGRSNGSGDGFSEYLVWDTPSFVSLDDLIVSSGSNHNYQAMGVPPLPKNRNAAFGTYKDELLRQLRELAKSEPNVDNDQDMIKSTSEFQSPMVTTQDIRFKGRSSGFEHKLEPNVYSSYEANPFQWCPDSSETSGLEFYSDQLVGNNTEANCIVPDEKHNNVHKSSHTNANHEGQSHHTVVENAPAFPAVALRELNNQERETALTRYKEKKKCRRYDKHIRYESRKVRAESRTRIRGRFAKMDR
uniref:zinc finger protein CONSTANS-LIKE 13 n=1 Tax=Erigeron canadensis TaxID=72917 RepID=UPI001CB9BF02|nr:zinc finger protein CONSTANS-LIKE 13 [Erigeron canadensis]